MTLYCISLLFFIITLPSCFPIQCYTGLKLIAGQSVGSATVVCDNSQAYCYNMTANAAVLIDVVKAGCSMWRCMLARDKCISTVFQNVPISLCCCSKDLCNVGENQNLRQQVTGGWNAQSSSNPGESKEKQWTKEEVANKFSAAELDDEIPPSTTRSNRLGSEVHIP